MGGQYIGHPRSRTLLQHPAQNQSTFIWPQSSTRANGWAGVARSEYGGVGWGEWHRMKLYGDNPGAIALQRTQIYISVLRISISVITLYVIWLKKNFLMRNIYALWRWLRMG
jgi:hypothetical protein